MTAPPRPTSIILADDDARFRALVRSVLEEDGYLVVGEASSAAEAVALVRDLRPDAAVIDLVMEGSDGLSTVADLREAFPNVPVVVISSLFDPIVEQQVVSMGAWYMEKVEGLEVLENLIDGAVSVTSHGSDPG